MASLNASIAPRLANRDVVFAFFNLISPQNVSTVAVQWTLVLKNSSSRVIVRQDQGSDVYVAAFAASDVDQVTVQVRKDVILEGKRV